MRKARSTHSRLIVRLMTGVVFFTSLLPIINNKKYNLPHNFLLSPCFIILKKLRIIINRKVNITVRIVEFRICSRAKSLLIIESVEKFEIYLEIFQCIFYLIKFNLDFTFHNLKIIFQRNIFKIISTSFH